MKIGNTAILIREMLIFMSKIPSRIFYTTGTTSEAIFSSRSFINLINKDLLAAKLFQCQEIKMCYTLFPREENGSCLKM